MTCGGDLSNYSVSADSGKDSAVYFLWDGHLVFILVHNSDSGVRVALYWPLIDLLVF